MFSMRICQRGSPVTSLCTGGVCTRIVAEVAAVHVLQPVSAHAVSAHAMFAGHEC